MSYPVNDRSFVLNAEGSRVCKTLNQVFGSLEDLPEESRERVLITDIFPYVGHASMFGRQILKKDGEIMIARATKMLALNPTLIVAAGEASRWAFSQALMRLELNARDSTTDIGIPSCVVDQRTIIIVEPHPSNATYSNNKFPFQVRKAFVKAVLLRAKQFSMPANEQNQSSPLDRRPSAMNPISNEESNLLRQLQEKLKPAACNFAKHTNGRFKSTGKRLSNSKQRARKQGELGNKRKPKPQQPQLASPTEEGEDQAPAPSSIGNSPLPNLNAFGNNTNQLPAGRQNLDSLSHKELADLFKKEHPNTTQTHLIAWAKKKSLKPPSPGGLSEFLSQKKDRNKNKSARKAIIAYMQDPRNGNIQTPPTSPSFRH